MKPRVTVLTLGVDDLERSVAFYRDGLGLPTQGIVGREFEYGAVAFFDLQPGLRLALWPRKSIALDSGTSAEATFGHNVASRAEVDAVMREAEQAGANLVKPAADTFWGGYAGYFRDPDGHLWEVVWNPQFIPDQGGSMASRKQKAAAKRNVKKAQKAAKSRKTLQRLPKKTRSALGREGAKAAKRKRKK